MRSLCRRAAHPCSPQTAKIEPALEPPAGESWSSSSAQVTRRCTCIKRALVRNGGRRQARQEGVLELARDPTTGRHKTLEGRVVLVIAFEHARGSV